MATKTIRVSDLSNSEEEVEAIAFTIAGQSYTIDLTSKEREAFLESFERYLAVATPAVHTRGAGKPKAEKSGPTQAQLMREWAKANGVDLPAKGVVPKEVRAMYREAMAKEVGTAIKEDAKGTPTEEVATPTPAKQTLAKGAPAKATAPKVASTSK